MSLKTSALILQWPNLGRYSPMEQVRWSLTLKWRSPTKVHRTSWRRKTQNMGRKTHGKNFQKTHWKNSGLNGRPPEKPGYICTHKNLYKHVSFGGLWHVLFLKQKKAKLQTALTMVKNIIGSWPTWGKRGIQEKIVFIKSCPSISRPLESFLSTSHGAQASTAVLRLFPDIGSNSLLMSYTFTWSHPPNARVSTAGTQGDVCFQAFLQVVKNHC